MEYNMPYVEGINWETAFHYMPTKETLFCVLEEIVKRADSQTEKLLELKKEVEKQPGPDSYKNYAIQAHAMKATLRTLGSDLFDDALLLELAGNEENENTIMESTDAFVKKYLKLTENLRPLLSPGEASSGFDETELFEKVTCIRKATDSFDISGLQDNMRQILQMKFPDKYRKEIRLLGDYVRDLDTDGILRSCEELNKLREQ